MVRDVELLIEMLPWLNSHPGRSVAEVAKEFNISQSHVYLLLNLLRETGIGLYYGEQIEITIEDDWIQVNEALNLDRPVRMNSLQATTLLAGLTFLEQMPALAESSEVSVLIEKVSEALAPQQAVEVVTPERERDNVVALKNAIANNVCVEIEYSSGTATGASQRMIEPKLLSARDNRTYVRAYCHEASALRSFRADRITTLRVLDVVQHVEVAPEAFVDEYQNWIPVEVRLSREYLGDFDQSTVTNMKDIDGLLQISARVASLAWLASITLSAGGGIEIVEPADARELVQQMAFQWAAQNS
ncbi:MAG: WYL domain-containing protein [Actinomycetes bacterium]